MGQEIHISQKRMFRDTYYYIQYIFSRTTSFDTGSGSVESDRQDLSKTGLKIGKLQSLIILFLVLLAQRKAVNIALRNVYSTLNVFGNSFCDI